MTATPGPAPDQALLVAACLKRGHTGPSRCRQVEPQQAVMVGPNGAVLATPVSRLRQVGPVSLKSAH